MIRTPEVVINLVIKSMPYPESVTMIDINKSSVIFEWRKLKFVVYCDSLRVEEIENDNFSIGSNISIILERLLKIVMIQEE